MMGKRRTNTRGRVRTCLMMVSNVQRLAYANQCVRICQNETCSNPQKLPGGLRAGIQMSDFNSLWILFHPLTVLGTFPACYMLGVHF